MQSVIGDIKEILHRVNRAVDTDEPYRMDHTYHGLQSKVSTDLSKNRIDQVRYVIEEIYRETNGDAIIVTEVGQHQMWAAQYYKYNKTENTSDIRWSWNNGIWSWCSDRCTDRQARINRSSILPETDVSV